MSLEEVFVSRSELWVKAVKAEQVSKYNIMVTGLQSFLSLSAPGQHNIWPGLCAWQRLQRELVRPSGLGEPREGVTQRQPLGERERPHRPTLVTHFIQKHMKEYSAHTHTHRGTQAEKRPRKLTFFAV